MSESVSINQILGDSCNKCSFSVKSLIILFVIVIFVLSTAYTNYVLKSFHGAVSGTEVSSFGTMIQALSIVILSAMLYYMEQQGIL